MDMENQERAMLEAESEEEETLEAESTEGALSISRVGRNFLNDREVLEAGRLHVVDFGVESEHGRVMRVLLETSAEADAREAELRERLARNQELQAGIDNELARQRGIQHRIESDLSAEDFERRVMIRAYHASFDGPNHVIWLDLIRLEGASFFTRDRRYLIPEALERDIRNQRWNEEQSDIADRRWHAALDRELENMEAIESHFMRFVRPRIEEHRVGARRPQVVESEFEGLAEEVIAQFLRSEPYCNRLWRFQGNDSDSDIGQSLTSDASEPQIPEFGDETPPVEGFQEDPEEESESEDVAQLSMVDERFISGCGNNFSGRPMVDSGAFTSCCPKNYAREVKIEEAPPLNLKSVLGESLKHYGVRKNVKFNSSGGEEHYSHDFQVTDCMRPILSVRDCNKRAELVCFGPNEKRIITDRDVIDKIEDILRKASGHQIIEEKGSYVLEGFRKEVTSRSCR